MPDISNPTVPAFKKLNLGCGFDIRQGYVNVDFQDFHKPDLVADVRELSMLPSGWFEEIIAQDVLEHPPRLDTPRALTEWSRLLCLGGLLYICGCRISLASQSYLSALNGQISTTRKLLVQFLFGTQAYTGDWHLTGFTESLVRHYLNEAGFEIVTLAPKDHWLFEVTARNVRSGSMIADKKGIVAGASDSFVQPDGSPSVRPPGSLLCMNLSACQTAYETLWAE